MAGLDRIPYEEAREWFWVRTAVWFVPAYIASAIAYFDYAGEEISVFKTRLIASLLGAFGAALLGVIAAAISTLLPWMRLGWRKLWFVNTIACIVTAGLLAVMLSAIVLIFIPNGPDHLPDVHAIGIAKSMMAAGIAIASFWGAAFGSWFALRRDRYFVQSI